MDTYYDDHDIQQENPKPEQKKTSPFADCDYVTPFDSADVPEINKKEKKKLGIRWASVLKMIVPVALCCFITGALVDARWQKKTEVSNRVLHNKIDVLQEQIDWLSRMNTENIEEAVLDGQLTPGQVYAQNVPAVVAIASQSTTTNIYGQATQTASAGSGFLISNDGYVVTNYHVVEGATSLSVLTYDGQVHTAERIGYDEANDICVLKIEGEDFPCVQIGSSNALGVGDQVVAIGNPLGELTSTLTVGYVSAKDRVVTTDGSTINMLQTDAAINAGNSGGPLFNMQGQVVGITTAKYSGTTESGASIEGIGFAIPMDDVLGMIQDIQENGYVSGAYLGVSVMDVSESAQMYGLPAGAYVDSVVSGLAADRAGLKKQDIIVSIGGYNVGSMADLTRVLRKFKPGDTTTISVYRNGQQIDMKITLDERPQEQTENVTVPNTPSQNFEDVFPDNFFDFFFGD